MKIGNKIKSSPNISDIHTIVSDIVNDCTGGYLWMYTYRFTYGSINTSIESI